jgi:hypothetical protein
MGKVFSEEQQNFYQWDRITQMWVALSEQARRLCGLIDKPQEFENPGFCPLSSTYSDMALGEHNLFGSQWLKENI